ncbi:MAG: SLC13 family permease [Pseudomonadota bacterium]
MTFLRGLSPKKLIAAALFAALGAYFASIVPTVEIAWVGAILLLTVYLFVFEIVEVDVAAIAIMILLGLTGFLAPVMGLAKGLVAEKELFKGFASNAVISIIAVMIIGSGLDKTGIMTRVARFLLKYGGRSEGRVVSTVSASAAFVSSFMQNVGTAALFLPVVSRISAHTGLPMSRMLIPMGFCVVLGGVSTMIGTSPLILLNDVMMASNKALPPDQQMAPWGLFSVTPVGAALVAAGILYFLVAGRFVLPAHKGVKSDAHSSKDYLDKVYGIGYDLHEVTVGADSPLVGKTMLEIEQAHAIRVVAVEKGDGPRFGAQGVDRNLGVEAGNVLGVLVAPDLFDRFVENAKVVVKPKLDLFAEVLSPAKAGIAEVVIPPRSTLIGKTARDIWMRKTTGLSLLAIYRGDATICSEGDACNVRDTPFRSGDALVVHTTWANLAHLERNPDYLVVTTNYPHEEDRPHKVVPALFFFVLSISLALFSDLRLSIALMTGALGMILTGVLSANEAYRAVSWKTVFLLAGLIPLGLAVENSGTAAFIAERTLSLLGGVPAWGLQAAIAILATLFSLVMSNIGATVLLVPLAVNMAIGSGADPALFALTVGIATSNSFLIPTHQVNALLMGPGGYRVADYIKAGGGMTVLFLVVALTVMNVVY